MQQKSGRDVTGFESLRDVYYLNCVVVFAPENTGIVPGCDHCHFLPNPLKFAQKMRTFLDLFAVKITRFVQLNFSFFICLT
jgi:hypothetical protein